MTIKVNVTNQNIRVSTPQLKLVSGSQNFVKFQFYLDSDWTGLTIFAQFIQNGSAYNVYLDSDNCVALPSEIVEGSCVMLIYGTGSGNVIATANCISLSITGNKLVADANSTVISQSLYDQLVARIDAVDSWSGQSVDDLEAVDADLQTQINKKASQTDLNTEIVRASKKENELKTAIDSKADQSDVTELQEKVENLSNNEVVAELVKSSVEEEIKNYLDSGVLANLVLADGSVTEEKLDDDLKSSVSKAESAMQPTMYDTQSRRVDVFDYAEAKAAAVQSNLDELNSEVEAAYKVTDSSNYTSLKEALQGVLSMAKSYTNASLVDYKAFTISIVDELPEIGATMTFYLVPNSSNTGYDKWWWIRDNDGNEKWDTFGSSSTVVVDSLPETGDVDSDYILKTNGGYLYYKYIDDAWEVIAGSLPYISATLPDVEKGDANTDYYILQKDSNVYVHYRFINGAYCVIGGDTYTKTEIDSKFTTVNSRLDTLEDNYSSQSTSLTTLGNKVNNLQTTMESYSNGKEYDIDYDETDGKLSLLEDGAVKTSVTIKGGGSGSSSASSTLSLEKVTSDPYVVLAEKDAIITFNFSDVDSDGDAVSATAYVTVDGTTVKSDISLIQGENSIDITDNVTVGTHKVRVYCSDDYGSSRYKEWTVRIVEISISSTYNDKYSVSVGRTVSVPYTPVGNVVKTVHFLLDGVELGTLETSSTGTALSYSIPSHEHGAYLFEMYITATVGGVSVETDHIYKDIIWYDEDASTPIIGCSMRSDYYGAITMRQYDTTSIVYNVYDPETSSPKFQIWVDGEKKDSGTLTEIQNTYRYKGETVGSHIVDIYVGDVVFSSGETVDEANSRYAMKRIEFNVTELGIDVSQVTGNLEVDFNPTGVTNASENRIWSNDNYSMSVSDNFDWANGGYKADENGDTYFLVKAGTRATFDYKMFDTTRTSTGIVQNATAYGADLKLIFMTENVQDKDAVWFSNVGYISSDESGAKMGIQLGVHEGWLKTNNASDTDVTSGEGDDAETVSASNTYLYMPYSEEDIIELDINIDTIDREDTSDKSFVMAYEDGVPSKAFVYDSTDNFYQSTPKPIVIGSDYCDVRIYRMKVYSTSLSTENVLKNFIADSRDSTTMLDRYDRNSIYYNKDTDTYTPYASEGTLSPEKLAPIIPNVKVLMLETDHFTTSKKTFVKANLRCIHASGGDKYVGDPYYDNWYFENGWHSGQGTTSDNYGNAGRNVDFLFNCDGTHKPTDKVKNPESDYISQVTLGYGTENAYVEKVTDWKGDTGMVTLTRTSVPNNFYNLKVNIASSENTNNALLQKRYNDYLPYVSPAKKRDSKVKNDMEFVPAVLFLRETNEDTSQHNEFLDTNWHFYALGNIGDSKKTDYTRAYDPDDMNEFTIEISDNTKNNATFQTGVYLDASGNRKIETYTLNASGDTVSVESPSAYVYPITEAEWNNSSNMRHYTLYNEGFDGDHSFEPRYACCGDFRDGKLVNDYSGNDDAQIEKNNEVWRAFYRWVVTSTDEQFVNELDDWCVRSAVEFFYAFTHYYTMTDSRAKNTFWHFAKTGTYREVTRPCKELLHVYFEKVGDEYVITSDTDIDSDKTYYTQYAFDLWDYDNDTSLGIKC